MISVHSNERAIRTGRKTLTRATFQVGRGEPIAIRSVRRAEDEVLGRLIDALRDGPPDEAYLAATDALTAAERAAEDDGAHPTFLAMIGVLTDAIGDEGENPAITIAIS